MSDPPTPTNPSDGSVPIIAYASPAASKSGRTPVGIVLFAASHLLLGAVLAVIGARFISLLIMNGYGNIRPGLQPHEVLFFGLIPLLAVTMLGAALALLLKGLRAW